MSCVTKFTKIQAEETGWEAREIGVNYTAMLNIWQLEKGR